jgi:prevent-host-death family protein
MNRFTKTDIAQKVSEVIRATFSGAVIITDRGKDSHVLMTIENYEEMAEKVRLYEELNKDIHSK